MIGKSNRWPPALDYPGERGLQRVARFFWLGVAHAAGMCVKAKAADAENGLLILWFGSSLLYDGAYLHANVINSERFEWLISHI